MKKTCTRCGETLTVSHFHRKKLASDGYRSACKKCRQKETREQYEKWREQILERNRDYSKTPRGRIVGLKAKDKYREGNREKIAFNERTKRRTDVVPWMLHNARLKARRKGYKSDLTLDDLILPEVCPVLGIPLMIGTGKVCQNSPSLDRIDNTKGYMRGNVIIVSMRANAIKNDATVEELGRVYRFYKDMHQKRDKSPVAV